jgi:excinuclease ABC subunit A
MQFLADVYVECPACHGKRYNRETLEVRYKGLNIAEALELTVDEAGDLFKAVPKLARKLDTMKAVGLGYLRLGQGANTLSGGEAQRLKLSLELSKRSGGGVLYILDEPTTGLHWVDIQLLLDLLFKLRDAGNTVIVIEHNVDVIRLADWVVDLGPGGGRNGGRLLYSGPVDGLIACRDSLTAQVL